MSEGEKSRLVAWYDEMTAVHGRLRRALELVRETADDARDGPRDGGRADPRQDLLVYCRGFCTALTRHHTSEDAALFPELERRHPELGAVVRALRQDHGMIAFLLADLEAALDRVRDAPVGSSTALEVARHLDGVGAIMESHFRYEERALGEVLAALDLDAAPETVLGPL
ncbi:hemerythrin domain-containing protein [Cellulosimicrobium cellulans]|uniref:hemerythrin domain-containing protein n=1 Tax=Cellulosimicrobium cellulans TaxID=1710 RepID=UPI0008495487|nr:hemerythrin domain-containing protein [Cellulosimicrobium cellulans]